MTSMTRTSPPFTRLRRARAAAGRVLHLAAVGATLLVALLLGLALLPNAWGWSSMVVTSGSMQPALDPGDVVLVEPRDATALEPMDIVTYVAADGSRVTHRIIDKSTDSEGTSFITKGDANEEADPSVVKSRNVLGQVHYSVPRVGYLIAWARTPLGLIALALGLAYVAFGGSGRRQGDASDQGTSNDVAEVDEDHTALVKT